jgi:hypothetical protein
MTRFVEDTTRALLAIWAQRAQFALLDHSPSALTLLAAEETAPYAAPLGDR